MKHWKGRYVFFRRILCLLLALLILPAAGAGAAVSRDKAREAAYAALLKEMFLSASDVTPGQEGQMENGNPVFYFIMKNHSRDNDGLLGVEISRSGALVSISGPNPVYLDQQIRRQMSALMDDYLSMEEAYQLRQDWLGELPAIERELKQLSQQESHKESYASQYLYAMLQEILLPDSDMLNPSRGLELARQSVTALPGWSEQKLDMYRLYSEICYLSREMQKPAYLYVFSRKYQSDSEYQQLSNESYERLYWDPLKKMFGGLPPEYVSVRLDACTGRIEGEPYEAYIRKDDFARELWQLK